MKKIRLLFLIPVALLCLTGCGTTTPETTKSETPTENAQVSENTERTSAAESSESSSATEPAVTSEETTAENDTKAEAFSAYASILAANEAAITNADGYIQASEFFDIEDLYSKRQVSLYDINGDDIPELFYRDIEDVDTIGGYATVYHISTHIFTYQDGEVSEILPDYKMTYFNAAAGSANQATFISDSKFYILNAEEDNGYVDLKLTEFNISEDASGNDTDDGGLQAGSTIELKYLTDEMKTAYTNAGADVVDDQCWLNGTDAQAEEGFKQLSDILNNMEEFILMSSSETDVKNTICNERADIALNIDINSIPYNAMTCADTIAFLQQNKQKD